MKRSLLIGFLLMLTITTPEVYASTDQNTPSDGPTSHPPVTVPATLPNGFNPLTAANADLSKYGFPPRPTNSVDLASWETAMKDFKQFVIPQYGTSTSSSPVITSSLSTSSSVSGTVNGYSPNWAGYMDYNTTGYGFTDVEGTWPVTPIYGSSTSSSEYSTWVGIGGNNISGHNSRGLLQAGTDVVWNNGLDTSRPWFQIVSKYPTMQPINNLTIYNGDLVYVDISYTPNIGGTFSYYFEDESTGQTIPVQYITGISQYYDGTEAEWVTERPQELNGSYTTLGDFENVAFSSCSTNNSNNLNVGFADANDYQLWHLAMTSNGQSTGTILDNASSVTQSTVGFTDYWHAYS